jgi:hypothetical protein
MSGGATTGFPSSRDAQRAPSVAAAQRAGSGRIFVHIGVQIACQLALLIRELAPARAFFRSAAFGFSLLLLVMTPGWSQGGHRLRAAVLIVMIILTLSAFNPGGGAPLAVVAHWSMSLAIVAPLFWVSRLDIKANTLANLLIVLWVFHTASSVVGLLQVYFPGRFMPALTTFISEKQMLTIRLASGEWIPRPMGLTDTPGAVAGSGMFATLLGFGVGLARPFRGAWIAAVFSMIAGVSCIYLSQVRSMLVMLGICFIALMALSVLSGRVPRLAWTLLIAGVVAFVGFEVAFVAAGDTITTRFGTLLQDDPGTIYRMNRGRMVEAGFSTFLPEYPLGAGLGHWGMVNAYFGSGEHEIGAEVQWLAWILDGGLPLVVAYLVAILIATYLAVRASLRPRGGQNEAWCAVVAACDVGTLALCFSYTPFMSSAGVEFWLLNAVLIQSERAPPELR